jgi:siroheme synthase
VVLMGVAERATIAHALIDGGLPADRCDRRVGRATTDAQTIVRCRIDQLGEADVRSPATLVIGAVAALNVGDDAVVAAYAV